MSAGIWNLVFGLASIAAGASGRFYFIGTHSSTALLAVGGALAALGVYQIARSRKAGGS